MKKGTICLFSFFMASVLLSVFVLSNAQAQNSFEKKVLVAYDSKHGSTKEVAEYIGDIFAEMGFQADIETAYMVDDVSQYDAVVLGSPLYYSTFLPGALQFLEKHKNMLALKKVAVFALSTSVDKDTGRVNEHVSRVVIRVIERFPDIEVLEPIGLLPGKYFLKECFPVEFISLKMTGLGEAGDLINYDFIREWVEEIAPLL